MMIVSYSWLREDIWFDAVFVFCKPGFNESACFVVVDAAAWARNDGSIRDIFEGD